MYNSETNFLDVILQPEHHGVYLHLHLDLQNLRLLNGKDDKIVCLTLYLDIIGRCNSRSETLHTGY